MATLSRDASAARLLLDLTALSVKEPTRDRCVRLSLSMIYCRMLHMYVVFILIIDLEIIITCTYYPTGE